MDADRLAPFYRSVEYAAFGRALHRARFALLDRLAGAQRILVLGEGDGRTLQRLLTIAPRAQIDVVDSSASMIALARARIGNTDRVRFFHHDAALVPLPAGTYDGVVTNFFLDCFTEPALQSLLQGIGRSLASQATWIVSDFAIPDGGLRRLHARVWIWTMYRFFRITTGLRAHELPPIQHSLSQIGLRSGEIHQQRGGMIFSQVWMRDEILVPPPVSS